MAKRIDTPEDRPRPHWQKELLGWVRPALIAFVAVFLIQQFAFHFSTVEGHSMEPTLYDDERLFINKAAYWFGDPERGDVVVLEDPRLMDDHREKLYLVKRIIGVPGDTVEIRNHRLYINGEYVEEHYIAEPAPDYGPVKVADGYYFVLGDNRNNSTDSRMFGCVPRSSILGRADYIVWPVSKAGGL